MPLVIPSPAPLSTPARPCLAHTLLFALAALGCALASFPRSAAAQTPVSEYGYGKLICAAGQHPSGELVLTGGKKDAIIRGANSSINYVLSGHTDEIRAASFARNSTSDTLSGQKVVTGSADGTARVWYTSASTQQGIVLPHPRGLRAVDISPGGDRVVTWCEDGNVRVWDVASTRTLQAIPAYAPYCTLSLDGRKVLMSNATDGTKAQLWDITTTRTLQTFTGHSGTIQTAAFSPDEGRVLTGSADNTARIWDVPTGLCEQVLAGHTAPVISVDWVADLQGTVMTASLDKTVRFWESRTGKLLKTLDFSAYGALYGVTLMGNGSLLMIHFGDGCIRFYQLSTNQIWRTYSGYANSINSVAFSPLSGTIYAVDDYRKVNSWNTNVGVPGRVFAGHQSAVTALDSRKDVSGNAIKILTASLDKTAIVQNSIGTVLNKLQGHASHVTCASLTPDGSKALTGSDDKTVRLWDLSTSRTLFTFTDPTTSVSSLSVSADGKKALVGDWAGTVHVYDLQQGKRTAAHTGFSYAVTSLAFSPDGTKALVGGCDITTFTARLIDVASGEYRQSFAGHRDDIIAVAFSPNGNRVLTASYDHTVKLWGINGRPILTLSGFGTGYMTSIAFSPDGTQALTGGTDGIVRLWDVSKNGVGLWDRFE